MAACPKNFKLPNKDSPKGWVSPSAKVRVLPPDLAQVILDWSHPRLPDASPYFAAGMEWWGVFLFTVHVPALGRLTGIAGSATD